MKRQQGLTMTGFLFLAIALVFAALLGFKVLPAYLEYFSIQRALSGMAHDLDLQTATPKEIRSSFDNRAAIDNITTITGQDLEIDKEGNRAVVRAIYAQKIPLFANISAYIEFQASTDKRK
ncbi:MAG TPA: DUF4845 domain-containing protein [Burkholderiales bacterium]|nr:DUF4845 domain-containing protein [Burkholderiales bacterium]